MIKTMISKMTTNSQLSTTEPKKQTNKSKLSKQLEQEHNHRNGDKGTENKQYKWYVENRWGG